MKKISTHTRTCKSGAEKVQVLIVEIRSKDKTETWFAVKGAHTAFLLSRDQKNPTARPLRSGCQLNNVKTDDMFTYYGNGTHDRPDNIADMKTFLWLLRDKVPGGPMEITKFWMLPGVDRAGVTDSLLLPSGTEVISANIENQYEVFVRVCGDVKILWKDCLYKDVSQFPEDLVEFIRKGNPFTEKMPADSEIQMNNWYEIFVYNETNTCLLSEPVDLDLPSLTEKQARELVLSTLKTAMLNEWADDWTGGVYPGIEDIRLSLRNRFLQEVECYDSCISDGIDDEESSDEYVMQDCFSLEDGTLIRVFYGNVTRVIGHIDIDQNA